MSLGWLSESTLLPKKRKEIEGVTANTMVELKALIYEQQTKAKKLKKTPKTEFGSLGGKNKGVEDRIQRDISELKKDKPLDSYENMKRKAEIYQKMMKGEMDESEDNLIDFQRKKEEEEVNKDKVGFDILFGKELVSNDMKKEVERKNWEKLIQIETEIEDQKNIETKNIEKLSSLTSQAREKVKKIRNEKKNKVQQRILKLKAQKGLK